MSSIRAVNVTKDRPGSFPLSCSALGLALSAGDELWVYDDGHRPASADYAGRFALDLAMQRDVSVVVKRGKPQGVHLARARALEEAKRDRVEILVMVDDDILVPEHTLASLEQAAHTSFKFDGSKPAWVQYTVPVIGLANNEAGVERFGEVADENRQHEQQFVLDGSGTRAVRGGAWTCCIVLNLGRFDVDEAVSRLRTGPSVVEDYVLTQPLRGIVKREALVWHVMSPEQGLRDWNGKALAYLREHLGGDG